jgi:ABC-type multidrug transport system fused ATPase/permease subunit
MKQMESLRSNETTLSPWRTLFHLAFPFRTRILLIIVLAALSTAATLIEPLIYRVAVNDVAGLFVNHAQQENSEHEESSPSDDTETTPVHFEPATYQIEKRQDIPKQRANPPQKHTRPHTQYLEPHRRDYVAPRTPAQTFNTFIWAIALMFGLSIVGYFIWLLADNMSAKLASQIESGFIQGVFGHTLRLPLGFFGRRASGALAKQIDQSDQVSPIVNAFTQTIIPELMTVIGAVAIMLTQNLALTLIALVTLPPYLIVAWRSAKRLEKGLEDYYQQWEDVSGTIQDCVSAIKTVKLSGAEEREIEKFRTASAAAYQAYVDRNKLGNKFVFWEHVITQVGNTMVLGLGGWFALKRQLTPGDVVMFVSYVGMLYNPIDSLTGLAVELQQYGIALRRALRLTQVKIEKQEGAPLNPGPGQIEFRDVHFSYVPGREVLSGLSLTIKPGDVVGLVGPSGAGKTTTADLLLRLYEPDSGSILIDGQALSDLNAASLRREIGVVAADGSVFRGTIADNIRYRSPGATDEEVEAVALAAGLGSALERLPDGIESQVGEGGVGLSVGERQRLQLARIFAANPRIMVLDEATANLDYATELAVKHALDTLRRDRTTIVIAHRFSMIKDADFVYVLESGRVLESGTPDELVANGGWFAGFASGVDSDECTNDDDDIFDADLLEEEEEEVA